MKKRKIKEETMNYSDLCDYFEEEKREGGAKTRQFERWKKEYSIEKIVGKNLYIVRPLTQTEKLSNGKYVKNFKKQLRACMFAWLWAQESSEIYTTYDELFIKFNLTNSNIAEYNKFAVSNICDRIGMSPREYYSVKREVYSLYKPVIDDIFAEMGSGSGNKDNKKEGLNIITKSDCVFLYTDTGNKHVIQDPKVLNEKDARKFLDRRNEISNIEYGKIFVELTDNERSCIMDIINEEYKCKSHKTGIRLLIDNKSFQYIRENPERFEILSEDIQYKVTVEDAQKMNLKSLEKFYKSERGYLKEVPDTKIKKYGNNVIKKNKKDLLTYGT